MKEDENFYSKTYSEKRGVCVTVIILGIMIGIFAIAYITFGNESKVESEAVKISAEMVTVIFRHGEVAPLLTFQNDPYKNGTYWPFGRGELTKKGRQNMFALGKFLRDRYTGFLPDIYYPSDVRAVSSDTNRCFMSAATMLAGLYPPHKFQVWNPYILWQPIPIKQIPTNSDNMLDIVETCPRLTEELKFWESDIAKNETLQAMLGFLSEQSGSVFTNVTFLREFNDLFSVQISSGYELPEFADSVFLEKLYNYTMETSRIYTMVPTLIRLGTGTLLKDILQHMKFKSDPNNTVPKLFSYAVNDLTIVKLMHVLNANFRDAKLPGFGASIIIELHYVSEVYIVEIFYMKHHNSKHVIPLNITGCNAPCPLEQFIDLTDDYIPQNWQKECQL